MKYGNYTIHCTLDHDAMLPIFKGSAFRGGFGHALKRTVCAVGRAGCEGCLLGETCVYVRVFEPNGWGVEERVIKDQGGLRRNALPHPFVIVPPLHEERWFSKGASFDFGLLLFGEANDLLAYFIYAFEQMGRAGIGERTNGKRGGFSLDRVMSGTTTIFSRDAGKLSKPETRTLAVEPASADGKVRRMKVTLESPLRLKFENRLNDGLPFHVLTRAMLRRVSTLSAAFGQGEPDLDYKGMVKRAEHVMIVQNRLAWLDVKRYSSRQDQAMLMGGVTGSVTYEGDLDEFMPLVDFCTQVHLGKQTTFGLGKIRVETV